MMMSGVAVQAGAAPMLRVPLPHIQVPPCKCGDGVWGSALAQCVDAMHVRSGSSACRRGVAHGAPCMPNAPPGALAHRVVGMLQQVGALLLGQPISPWWLRHAARALSGVLEGGSMARKVCVRPPKG